MRLEKITSDMILRIMYWETNRRMPDKETAHFVFPDKTTRDYEVEALKVLDQSLEALDRRNMTLLFCLLKFRKEVKKTGVTVERRKALAGALKEMSREMERLVGVELAEGRLSAAKTRIIALLEQSCTLEQIKRKFAHEAGQQSRNGCILTRETL
jgi:hypothetical protein